MNKSQIEELEKLAKEFIIGYKPLTEKQRGLIVSIRAAEEQRDILMRMVNRYDNVIQVMYGILTRR